MISAIQYWTRAIHYSTTRIIEMRPSLPPDFSVSKWTLTSGEFCIWELFKLRIDQASTDLDWRSRTVHRTTRPLLRRILAASWNSFRLGWKSESPWVSDSDKTFWKEVTWTGIWSYTGVLRTLVWHILYLKKLYFERKCCN